MLVQAAGHTFERPGYARAWSLTEPSPVISGTLDKAVVRPPGGYVPAPGEAFAVANFGTDRGGHVREVTEQPMGTLTAGGHYGISQQAILRGPREAVIASYYGGSTVTADAASDPFRTQTAVDRHALIEPPPARSSGPAGRDKRTSLTFTASRRRRGCHPRTTAPSIGGELPYRVEDAEFRMITPERVRAGDGHPPTPRPAIRRHVRGYPLPPQRNQCDRVRLAGNSLTPGVEAEILDRALLAQAA